MNRLGRALQLLDRFNECTRQLSFSQSISVFSYLWGDNSVKSINLNGKKFYFQPKSDKGVMSHFYKEGYRILGEPKLIFDVGANIGDETLRFRHFHPEAQVVAIEASSRNIEFLKKNFSQDPSVYIFPAALWHSAGVLHLSSGQSHESCSIAESFCKSPVEPDLIIDFEDVNALTVVDVLNSLSLQGMPIDIFKIDVEGAEKYIFCQGDTSWLDNVKVIIMEMPDNDSPGSFQEISNVIFSCCNKWSSHICGENIVLIRKDSGFSLQKVIGLGY